MEAGGPRAAVWDPTQTLGREMPSQFPASPSVSPLVSFPGQLLSLAPANAAPGKQRCRQEQKRLPVPQGLKVALSSCHTPHPAHTCPGQAVPSANSPTGQASRSHTRHSTDRGHHPTHCLHTHLQVHLVLDGLPICPPQPAPRLPCTQGTPWARGMAQPGGLQPVPPWQDTVASGWREPVAQGCPLHRAPQAAATHSPAHTGDIAGHVPCVRWAVAR